MLSFGKIYKKEDASFTKNASLKENYPSSSHVSFMGIFVSCY